MYQLKNFLSVLTKRPQAMANIKGSPDFPKIDGTVVFYKTDAGVLVVSFVTGLPSGGTCEKPVFGFHIHGGTECTGDEADYFKDALTHFNPEDCPHPYHAGDMPPLFGVNTAAFSAFLTDRFSVVDILGKTVIIHSSPDDFTTQPAGNSGTKIACGKILPF